MKFGTDVTALKRRGTVIRNKATSWYAIFFSYSCALCRKCVSNSQLCRWGIDKSCVDPAKRPRFGTKKAAGFASSVCATKGSDDEVASSSTFSGSAISMFVFS